MQTRFNPFQEARMRISIGTFVLVSLFVVVADAAESVDPSKLAGSTTRPSEVVPLKQDRIRCEANFTFGADIPVNCPDRHFMMPGLRHATVTKPDGSTCVQLWLGEKKPAKPAEVCGPTTGAAPDGGKISEEIVKQVNAAMKKEGKNLFVDKDSFSDLSTQVGNLQGEITEVSNRLADNTFNDLRRQAGIELATYENARRIERTTRELENERKRKWSFTDGVAVRYGAQYMLMDSLKPGEGISGTGGAVNGVITFRHTSLVRSYLGASLGAGATSRGGRLYFDVGAGVQISHFFVGPKYASFNNISQNVAVLGGLELGVRPQTDDFWRYLQVSITPGVGFRKWDKNGSAGYAGFLFQVGFILDGKKEKKEEE